MVQNVLIKRHVAFKSVWSQAVNQHDVVDVVLWPSDALINCFESATGFFKRDDVNPAPIRFHKSSIAHQAANAFSYSAYA